MKKIGYPPLYNNLPRTHHRLAKLFLSDRIDFSNCELIQDLDELWISASIVAKIRQHFPATEDLGEAILLIDAVSGACLLMFSRDSPTQARVEEFSEHDFSDACYSRSGEHLAIYSRKGFYLLVYEAERDVQSNVKLVLLFSRHTYAIRFGGDTRNSYM